VKQYPQNILAITALGPAANRPHPPGLQNTPAIRRRLKTMLVVAGLGAVVAMGALTIVVSGPSAVTGISTVIADTTTSSAPASTPTTPSATPTMKATPFQGGDWPTH
jgi:hypothetical protein